MLLYIETRVCSTSVPDALYLLCRENRVYLSKLKGEKRTMEKRVSNWLYNYGALCAPNVSLVDTVHVLLLHNM